MVKKILKWVGIVLGGLAGLVVLAAAIVWVVGGAAFNKKYDDITPQAVTIPSGPEAVERGKHIATTRDCFACHGDDLSGTEFINEPALAVIPAPNLTSGSGGIGASYTDEDWVLAIRHGVSGVDHRGLLIMPARMFTHLNDEDLGALIAYLKSLPPVDHQLPDRQVGLLGRMALATNQFQAMPDLIDHNAARPVVSPGPTREYGEYLAKTTCTECHGDNLTGLPWPPGQPTGLTPNLTPAGELQFWKEADFIKVLRTGEKPGGGKIDTEEMPVKYLKNFSDDELKALWAYLSTLEPAEPVSK